MTAKTGARGRTPRLRAAVRPRACSSRAGSARLLLLLAPLIVLASCETLRSLDVRTPGFAAQDPAVKAIRAKLVEGANLVLGRTSLSINGRTFGLDCSGTVRAIYWYAGIDLARDFPLFTGNGVARIHSSLDSRHLLYTTRSPLTGDIIFWDNTYDMNRDGIWNDFLTHVGMVVGTAGDGTISYIHYHDKRGIVIEYMNLLEPATNQKTIWGRDVILNSPLRATEPGKARPQLWLSGQLYRTMGMGYLF